MGTKLVMDINTGTHISEATGHGCEVHANG
jgi:hypothetical protein